jgi:DNA-binding NarL/FixJ family response regulator
VDDHFVVRIGLAAALNAEADLRVVAEAEDGFAAIELFRKHLQRSGCTLKVLYIRA